MSSSLSTSGTVTWGRVDVDGRPILAIGGIPIRCMVRVLGVSLHGRVGAVGEG